MTPDCMRTHECPLRLLTPSVKEWGMEVNTQRWSPVLEYYLLIGLSCNLAVYRCAIA
jgi:hypothetical protein